MDVEVSRQYHTTATSAKTGNTTTRFDISYIQTLPGTLKVLQVAFNLLGFLCVIMTVYEATPIGRWFDAISMIGFWMSSVLLAFYLFHIIEQFQKIPWIKIEFCYCLILLISNSLTAGFMTGYAKYSASLGAAAFFGFCTAISYGCDAWLKFLDVKTGEIAQIN